jgi:hypothetical protein
MKRILFGSVLGLAAYMFSLPGYARGIGVDETITCSKTVPPTGSLWIENTRDRNRAKAGVNFPVLVCAASSGTDANVTPLTFDPASSVLYTWVDLSVAGASASSLGLVAKGGGLPLSNFPTDVSIVAQVEVIKLTGRGYEGNYEIMFNYETSSPVFSACSNVFKPIAPSFDWYGTTYVFTGADGISPCDPNSTNDFLFDSKGKLRGYFDSSGAEMPGLPPGWKIVKERDK